MPRYLFPDGEIQTLSRRTAADVAAVYAVVEVDAIGQPVPPASSALATAIEQLRAHEQVTVLEAALVEAQARVADITTLLRTAQDALTTETDDVTAQAAARAAAAAAAAAEAPPELEASPASHID